MWPLFSYTPFFSILFFFQRVHRMLIHSSGGRSLVLVSTPELFGTPAASSWPHFVYRVFLAQMAPSTTDPRVADTTPPQESKRARPTPRETFAPSAATALPSILVFTPGQLDSSA